MSRLRRCCMLQSMSDKVISVNVNKFSLAGKLKCTFLVPAFQSLFFLSLAARKQIRACFVVCLHKDQLSSSVSARREKHVCFNREFENHRNNPQATVKLCSYKKKTSANLLWQCYYFKSICPFEWNAGFQCCVHLVLCNFCWNGG